uniref:Cid1 n=1 Tax=Drosophila auraria TaxID=47315 RepID=A0A1V0HRT0_DROAV|nr:Cid1 [Drosophila auraria]ARC76756.1 Cid1 [Drosophila auraria]ARC76762.1 Cid1 [Drosophila auraria]ARC76764.1 Cid1 [Drosophila auraria]
MRTLRVKESQSNDNSSTGSSSSGSLEDLDDHLAGSTSRLTLQDANNRSSTTPRTRNLRSSRSEADQENRLPQTRQNSSQRQERGALAPAPAPAPATPPRRRKQRPPVSRANQMEREIRRLRNRTVPLIPRLPFSRLVREVMLTFSGRRIPLRITEGAVQVLQESTELYLTQRFEDAYLLTHHRGRVTLEVRDMVLMAYLIDVSHYRS